MTSKYVRRLFRISANKQTISVTVIIPVYNVIDYLEDCLNSVLNQSYSNLEIILIDDGSYDGSQSVCDKTQAKDSRVKVIHQQNKGLSAARNAGLDLASGEYIMFLDSDDYWETDTVAYMLELAIESKADMVIGEYRRIDEDGEITSTICNNIKEKYQIMSEDDIWDIANRIISVVVWSKIYRSSIWLNLRFAEGRIHEDQTILHYIIKKCTRITYTNKVIINYRVRPNSIMSQSFNIHNLDYAEGLLGRIEYFKEKGDFSRVLYTFGEGSRSVIKGYQLLDKTDQNVKIILDKLYHAYRETAKYIFIHSCDLKTKVRMQLFIHNIVLYNMLRKTMSIIRKGTK